MCIHHFFYHNPNLLVRNPYLTSISHCDYVNSSLEFYHSQRYRKPLQILGTADQNPEALRMPEACPIDWDLQEGEAPPEIGVWRIPSWEIQENRDAHAEPQRGGGRERGQGRRGRRRPRMSHPWAVNNEQGGTERALGPARMRGNVSCRVGWLENEERRSPPHVNDSRLLDHTPLAHTPLAHASGTPRGSHACELPSSQLPTPDPPAANRATIDSAPSNHAAPTLSTRTLSPPLSTPPTGPQTTVPSPTIPPYMSASFNSAPASYPLELPTPQTDVFWTGGGGGGVPWLVAEGLSEAESERMRQEEEERRILAMGRVEAWRGDGGMGLFNHGFARVSLEGQGPVVYAIGNTEAWNPDRALWADTPPPTFPNSNASTMVLAPGNQQPPPSCPPAPTPLNPTATPFTMPSPSTPHQPQSPPQPSHPPHPRHRGPIIINSDAFSETQMQEDFDWTRWERRRQWEEMFGWFVAQARERGEDFGGGVEGLVGERMGKGGEGDGRGGDVRLG